jgi:hypothetical protein
MHATEVLVGALTRGGYQVVGLEMKLEGQAFGKKLIGKIDCVVERDGEEAIIDFKYGGRSKYSRLIEEGKAVQLATYAYGRSNHIGKFPAVAYLVLADGLLFTPSGSPIQGDGNRTVIDGPAIQSVWNQFSDAIERAGDWLTTDEPVPARPLQDSSQWPLGAELVLDADKEAGEMQSVCTYCDYQQLCGMRETL